MAGALEVSSNPINLHGFWIWGPKTTTEQTCQFWNSFVIPSGARVVNADLRMTADNEFFLFLDGRQLGRGAEWRELFVFDLRDLMTPGRHVFAVRAYNSSFFAGLLFDFEVELADGRRIEVHSGPQWKIVPNDVKGWQTKTQPSPDWQAATVIAPFGNDPWWKTPQNVNIMPRLEPFRIYFWQTGWFQITLLSVSAIVILISLRLLAQVALHRKEEWLLRQERARIARDIHDDLGSRMTRLVLHGEVTQSELPLDSRTRAEVEQICEQARGILSTLDEILWAVNPKRDTFRDFTTYVCGYAQDFLKGTSIHCLFDLDPTASDLALSLPMKRTLLMGIKEALNNAVKHSGASELWIKIAAQGHHLSVVVSDNGKGFDTSAPNTLRNGLANMAGRMKELGGKCVITSRPGNGCRTEFMIPLPRSAQAGGSWIQRWKRFGASRGPAISN